MDAIEKAIRGAFDKGNPQDRAFRERVYRSAFAALDRALLGNANVTVEAAIERRKTLQGTITEIEAEYISQVRSPLVSPATERSGTPSVIPAGDSDAAPPAVGMGEDGPRDGSGEAAEPDAPVPAVAAPDRARRAPMAAAGMAADREDRVRSAVAERAPPIALEGDADRRLAGPIALEGDADRRLAGEPVLDIAPGERRPRRRRRSFAILFIAATLLAAIGMGGWWAFQTGLLLSPAERDTAVPNPPQTVAEEDFVPENEAAPVGPAETDAGRDWITVFSPDDPTLVSTPADATAEVIDGDAGRALRIRSGESGSAVAFDVGQGILEQIAGKRAVFNIVARAEEGADTEMSVDCTFGELGDCGRKRYAVAGERAEYLFEVDLPQGSPGAAGSIAVNSDFAKGGKAVDVFEIKVSVVP